MTRILIDRLIRVINVFACPNCNSCSRYEKNFLHHAFESNYWTDGKGVFFDSPPSIAECSYCDYVYRLGDAKEVGKYEVAVREPAKLLPEPGWEELPFIQEPTESGYYRAINGQLAKSREEERFWRRLAWYRHNDPYRYRSIGEQLWGYATDITDDDVVRLPVVTPACQENLEILLTLLIEPERNIRIIKGEILRQLGRIEEAEALVALYRYKIMAQQIWELCKKGDTLVRMINPQEIPSNCSRLI